MNQRQLRHLTAICLAVTSGLASLPSHAGAMSWSAVNLAASFGLQGNTNAFSINQKGEIAALNSTGDWVVLDTTTGTSRVLAGPTAPLYPASAVADLNDRGQFTGSVFNTSNSFTEEAMIGDGSQVRSLGALSVAGSARDTEAWAMNDAGQVVGRASTGSFGYAAFITDADGSNLRSLGALAQFPRCQLPNCGTFGVSAAYDINNAGQVVGSSMVENVNFLEHAFITDASGGGMRDLGSLGSDNNSVAFAVNNSGQAVGWSNFRSTGYSSTYRGFISGANGGPLVDLGQLANGHTQALGLNDAGVAVGLSAVGSVFHAFIYGLAGQTVMQDLNDVVTLDAGVYLREAFEVNNNGQILAMGSNGQAYLVTATQAPVAPPAAPEPGVLSLALLGLGAACWSSRRRGNAASNAQG